MSPLTVVLHKNFTNVNLAPSRSVAGLEPPPMILSFQDHPEFTQLYMFLIWNYIIYGNNPACQFQPIPTSIEVSHEIEEEKLDSVSQEKARVSGATKAKREDNSRVKKWKRSVFWMRRINKVEK